MDGTDAAVSLIVRAANQIDSSVWQAGRTEHGEKEACA